MTVWCIVEFLCRRRDVIAASQDEISDTSRLRAKLAAESISPWFMPRLSFSGVTSAASTSISLSFSLFISRNRYCREKSFIVDTAFARALCLLSHYPQTGESSRIIVICHSFFSRSILPTSASIPIENFLSRNSLSFKEEKIVINLFNYL